MGGRTLISEFSTMEALIDCMVTFYREKYESLIKLYDAVYAANMQRKIDLRNLRRQYATLETYAAEQEDRADSLNAIIYDLIESSSGELRVELQEYFNNATRRYNVHVDLPTDNSDTESEDDPMGDLDI